MSAQLLIRIQQAYWPQVEWALLDATGNITLGPQQSELTEIPQPKQTESITVLVPGTAVTALSVQLPPTPRAQVRKVVPFALEEQLITDIETQHFALGEHNSDKSLNVAVIAKMQLQSWLTALQAAGLAAQTMLPDYLALPYNPASWTILLDGDIVLIRTAAETGYAVEIAYLPIFLRALIAKDKTGLPEALHTINANENLLAALAEFNLPIQPLENTEDFFTSAAKTLKAPAATLNLLQGEFRANYKYQALKRRWRKVAILGAAWLLVIVVGQSSAYFYLKSQQQKLQTQIEALAQQVLPNATLTDNSQAIAERELAKLKSIDSSPSFINLLAKLGNALQTAPAMGLTALQYENLQLTVHLKTSAKNAEQLVSKLNSQGLHAAVAKSAKSSEESSITIQAGSAA